MSILFTDMGIVLADISDAMPLIALNILIFCGAALLLLAIVWGCYSWAQSRRRRRRP